MAKKYRFFSLPLICLVVGVGFVSCTSTARYYPTDVTNTMAAQITSIPLHNLEPGENVKTLYLNRTGSVLKDLNEHEEGVWYRAHQDKIINLEAVIEETYSFWGDKIRKPKWRVEYVD